MVNSGLANTPLLQTCPLLRKLCESLAKTIINRIATTLAITDSGYYGIADNLCGPQQTLLFFYLVTTDFLEALARFRFDFHYQYCDATLSRILKNLIA